MNLRSLIFASFLLLSGVPVFTYAQTDAGVDSLKLKLKTERVPKTKLAIYLELINAIGDFDSAGTEKYAAEAKVLAVQLKDIESEAEIQRQLGIMYLMFDRTDQSLIFLQKALALSKKGKNKILVGDIYNNISNTYGEQNDYKLRDEYMDKALAVYRAENSEADIAMVYANMGSNFSRTGNYPKAIEFLLKSLKIREKLKDDEKIGRVAFNLSVSYKLLKRIELALEYNELATQKFKISGDEVMLASAYAVKASILRTKKDYGGAIGYINMALPIFIKYNQKGGIRNNYDNLGLIYQEKKESANALKYFNKSKEISLADDNKQGIVSADINIAQTALDMHNLQMMKAALEEAEPIALKNSLKQDLLEIYQLKVQYVMALSKRRGANLVFENYLILKDSLNSSDIQAQVTEMQTKYETEKKDAEINLLNKEKSIAALKLRQRNTVILVIGILIIAAVLLVYGYYRRNKLKQDAKLQAEVFKQQEIATKSLFEGEQKERVRIARDLHDSIGQMLSVVKMNVSNLNSQSPDDAITAGTLNLVDKTIEEVRSISHNLLPEALNFGLFAALEDMTDKINESGQTQVVLDVPDEARSHQFAKQNELSIYRIVQEVLGNMVKHAEATEINVRVFIRENGLSIAIKDNGKGFDAERIKESKGLGWKNISARVNMLDGEMRVQSEKLSGTQIEITIPA